MEYLQYLAYFGYSYLMIGAIIWLIAFVMALRFLATGKGNVEVKDAKLTPFIQSVYVRFGDKGAPVVLFVGALLITLPLVISWPIAFSISRD